MKVTHAEAVVDLPGPAVFDIISVDLSSITAVVTQRSRASRLRAGDTVHIQNMQTKELNAP